MDRKLLGFYEEELRHLREVGGEFATQFPKIAARLGLDDQGCADPYVERLLEGFAFLSARVQAKLEAEFPRFTQALLDTVYPSYHIPTPAMGIARFEPDMSDPDLADGVTIPRGTVLRSILGRDERTPCMFTVCRDLTLLPLAVTGAEYHTRDLELFRISATPGVRAAIRVRLRCGPGTDFSGLNLETLLFHLRGGDDPVPGLLYEQIVGHCRGVLLRSVPGQGTWRTELKAADVLSVPGFSDGEAMLPVDPRTYSGYRLLREYFTFPARYLFAELRGLNRALAEVTEREIDLVFLCDVANRALETHVSANHFALHCVPIINLFPKRTDRVPVTTGPAELQVIADRTRPLDYEVACVTDVRAYSPGDPEGQRFAPFYSATERMQGKAGGGAYFAAYRRSRRLSEREMRRGVRSSYLGSEVFLMLVDSDAAPYSGEIRELGVQALCSNRDLPLRMSIGSGNTDFTLDVNAPVRSIRCIAGPTAPQASFAESRSDWRVVNHLTLGLLSLVNEGSAGRSARVLQELLRLYCDSGDIGMMRQIEGVLEVKTAPVTRRAPGPGPISFVRGLEVSVLLNEDAFRGSSVFLLGAVLDRFFNGFVSINSFTETVIRSTERGEVMRWDSRSGIRPQL